MMTLLEAVELFLERPELRPQSKRTYGYDLKLMLDYLGGAKEVGEVEPIDIMRYAAATNKRVNSPFTYNKHVKTARTFFNWCVAIQLIDVSPAVMMKRKPVNDAVDEDKAMPERDLLKLLDYVAATRRGWYPREEALVRFLADTGCRISSAAALTAGDLDFDKCQATMPRKSHANPYTVTFGSACKHAMLSWMIQKGSSGHVFSPDGKPMTAPSLGQFFRRLCVRADIGSWGPHSLRHLFGHRAAKRYNPDTVAKMMGDSVEIVIKYYFNHGADFVQQAMKDMSTDNLSAPPNDVIMFSSVRTN